MTEAMVDDALVEVVQIDRDAAAHTVPDDGSHSSYMMVDAILEGRADDWPLVQAFARHRLAGVAAGREEAATVADRIADESVLVLDEHDARIRHEGIVAGARAAATAIRQRGE